MGPVRQNPIQRTVRSVHIVCIALCTIVAQNKPDSYPPYPPDNHHCSDDVDLREGGRTSGVDAYKKRQVFKQILRLCIRWSSSRPFSVQLSESGSGKWPGFVSRAGRKNLPARRPIDFVGVSTFCQRGCFYHRSTAESSYAEHATIRSASDRPYCRQNDWP